MLRMNFIDSFKGKYFFLSNFYPCEVHFEGLIYKNSEAAFQSAKTKDMDRRKQFCEMDPGSSKRKGRNLPIRGDWEKVKENVMYLICKDKFTRNPDLKKKLLSTDDTYLEEGNTWNDYHWGVCNGRGKNKLGRILMTIREELKANG